MLHFGLIIAFLFPGALSALNDPLKNDCTPIVTINGDKNNICSGNQIVIQAVITNDGTNGVYAWKKNNKDAGANSATFSSTNFRDGDTITCQYTCRTACGTDVTVVSNTFIARVVNDITPVITIANNDPLICEGITTLFTSVATYGNAIPLYQWTVNGLPVGSNSPEYATDSLTNGALVKCMLTITTSGCPGSKSDSSQMTIYVYPLIHPAIKIIPSRTDICRGESVSFTATANGGGYPSFAWEVNGVPTGDTSARLTLSNIKDGDSVSCTLTLDQDSRCRTATTAPSNKVGIHVKDYREPAVVIGSPLADVCKGTPVTFMANTINADSSKQFHWQVNKHPVGTDSPNFTSGQFADGDSVWCILSAGIPGCSITTTDSSNYEVVKIKAIPVITFSPPEISILFGDRATISASVSGNLASFTWDPRGALISPQALISETIPLFKDTVFKLTETDVNGCQTTNNLVVKVLYKMYMPSAFTPNNDGLNDLFRIPPGSSFTLSAFLIFDRWGHLVFSTTDITKGWDGTYQGKDVDPGTFVYTIRGIFQNRPVNLKGKVILLR